MENDKEAKSQESRLGWSIFLSIILHFVFIFLILHFYPDVPKTENKVITVRLAENQVSISQEKSSSNKTPAPEVKKEQPAPKKQAVQKKETTVKKNTVPKEKLPTPKKVEAKKPNKKVSKPIEKTPETKTVAKQSKPVEKEKIVEKKEVQIKEDIKPEKVIETVTEEVDIFSKLEQSQEDAKRRLEEDFFEDSNGEPELLPDFDFTDVMLAEDVFSEKDGQGKGTEDGFNKNNTQKQSDDGKDIEWSKGGARGLLYSTAIEVHEEVKKAGLKFVIEISFNVNADGFITNADIVKSSGNSVWDDDIRRQFKSWQFEKSHGNESSSGKIVITVGY